MKSFYSLTRKKNLGQHARERSSPEELDGVRLPIEFHPNLHPLRVQFTVDMEQLQDNRVPLALEDIVASVLVILYEAAGISFIRAAIEGPKSFLKGFSDNFLDMSIVIVPAALNEYFVLIRGACCENKQHEREDDRFLGYEALGE